MPVSIIPDRLLLRRRHIDCVQRQCHLYWFLLRLGYTHRFSLGHIVMMLVALLSPVYLLAEVDALGKRCRRCKPFQFCASSLPVSAFSVFRIKTPFRRNDGSL